MTTLRRRLMLLAAFATPLVLALPLFLMSDASAQRATAMLRGKDPTMKVYNAGARLMHIPLGTRTVSIAPLKTETLEGDDATMAKAVLEGPLHGYVDNGELVIDGRPKAAPPTLEPSQPSTGMPAMLTQPVGAEPGALTGQAEDRDTDPIPPASPPSAAQASQPSSSSQASRKR